MTKKRNTSIDCLRLVCMMMVVSMYYFGWGGINSSPETNRINFILASGITVFCRVAVNCFYMINGYFIKTREDEVSGRQILTDVGKQYKKIWFYSVMVFWFCCLSGTTKFSWKELLDSVFPIMSNQWWFMTVFVLLLCIRPFVGKLVTKLSDKELTVLLLSIAFFDCIQAIVGHNAFAEKGAGALHACFMLMLGYGMQRLGKLKLKKISAFVLYVGACVIAGGLSIVGKMIFKAEDAVAIYYNSPLIVAASVGMFAFFADWRCNWIWPSRVAPYLLAVYLINDHPIMQANFYEKVLHCSRYYSSNFMIVHWLACVIGFTAIGITIDFIVTMSEGRLRTLLRKG